MQILKLLCQIVKEEMHLKENKFFDLELGVKVRQNVAQYSLHHVTYTATKFEVATSNGLGDAFRRESNVRRLGQGQKKCCQVLSTSCDLYSCKV